MKKTTKFLLVLAAVVAMTIGAVSTVMAADYPVIKTWEETDKATYAYDANGNKINRGWAVSESGIYYYFVNNEMQTNRFIKTSGKTYFVGEGGAMHTGWLEVNKDLKVNIYGGSYNNIAEYWGTEVGTGEVFKAKTQYTTVWLYFNENGEMIMNDWAKADGVWYYMDGPYCLINEWEIPLVVDKKAGTYGFNESGAMMAGWIAKENKTTTGGKVNQGTPWEDDTTKTTSTTSWYYYGTNGARTESGWAKIDGSWFYFDNAVALSNTYLEAEEGRFVYFDNDCYMVEGTIVLNSNPVCKTVVNGVLADMDSSKAITGIDTKKSATWVTLTFKDVTGNLVIGQTGTKYYENGAGEKVKINVAASGSSIAVTTEGLTNKANGIQWTETFLYVWTNDKGKTVVNYYIDGEMVKLEAIEFGENVLAFDKNGNLVAGDKVTIGDYKYVASSDSFLMPGVPYSVITK